MRRKAVLTAIAGLLVAPASGQAQPSKVQLYGRIIYEYAYVDQGDRFVRVDGMYTNSTGIGIKGEEKLSGSLSAWFQCESSMDLTGADADGFCTRNSGIGIKGSLGNFFFGLWDTPYKLTHGGFYRAFPAGTVHGMRGLLWNESTGTGTNTNNRTSFHRRQTNSVNYHSPRMGGVRLLASYSSTNDSTSALATTPAAKPRLYSVGADYRNGPLGIAVGHERHSDYNPASAPLGSGPTQYASGDDYSSQVAAAYRFGGVFKLGAIYSRTHYDTANSTSLKADGWGVYGDWRVVGPHSIRAAYTQANDTSGNFVGNLASYRGNNGAGRTGATQVSVQYAYSFSKRTEVNVGYVKLNNEENSRHRLQNLPVRNPGQDQSAITFGVRHRF